MKNCNELRDKLTEVINKLVSGKMTVPVGKEIINATGKMINSAKVQLEYYALIKQNPNIAFLSDGEKHKVDKEDWAGQP